MERGDATRPAVRLGQLTGLVQQPLCPAPRTPDVCHSLALTLCAVLSGPAGQAGQAAIGLADVVAEAVVAALAEARAAVPVVVLAADHPVGVAQLGQRALLHILRPVLTHCQRPLDRHLADEPVLGRRLGAWGTTDGVSSLLPPPPSPPPSSPSPPPPSKPSPPSSLPPSPPPPPLSAPGTPVPNMCVQWPH